MTEFHDLELDSDVSDMEADEAKATLADFMEAHQKNRQAYDAARSELDDVESEYQEQIEEYEERIAEFTEQRAEEAAEYVNMPADLLADRFSIDELETIIDEGQEAGGDEDFSDEPEDEPEDDETLTTFSEKPEKGHRTDNSGSKYRETAKQKLQEQW